MGIKFISHGQLEIHYKTVYLKIKYHISLTLKAFIKETNLLFQNPISTLPLLDEFNTCII